jgi:hypothetical protein
MRLFPRHAHIVESRMHDRLNHPPSHADCQDSERPPDVKQFARLDRRSIAVRLLAPSGWQWLKGIAAYEADPDLGGVLRIAIADEVSPYELFFVESQWSGAIASGGPFGCDFSLSVG